MSSELLSLPCWSCFLIVSCCPSGCHAILLHQDSQIYDKMTSPSLKENIADKNWLELTQLFKELRTWVKIKLRLFFFIRTKQSCVLEVDVCWTQALQKLFTHKSTAGCISFGFLVEFELKKHCKTNSLLNSEQIHVDQLSDQKWSK